MIIILAMAPLGLHPSIKKRGDGQDTPGLFQGKTLGSHKPSLIREEGGGRRLEQRGQREDGLEQETKGAA